MAYMAKGKYEVRVTYRAVIHIENEDTVAEKDVVDEAINDFGAELVDWEVKKL